MTLENIKRKNKITALMFEETIEAEVKLINESEFFKTRFPNYTLVIGTRNSTYHNPKYTPVYLDVIVKAKNGEDDRYMLSSVSFYFETEFGFEPSKVKYNYYCKNFKKYNRAIKIFINQNYDRIFKLKVANGNYQF
jgi:hypothetical protein